MLTCNTDRRSTLGCARQSWEPHAKANKVHIAHTPTILIMPSPQRREWTASFPSRSLSQRPTYCRENTKGSRRLPPRPPLGVPKIGYVPTYQLAFCRGMSQNAVALGDKEEGARRSHVLFSVCCNRVRRPRSALDRAAGQSGVAFHHPQSPWVGLSGSVRELHYSAATRSSQNSRRTRVEPHQNPRSRVCPQRPAKSTA